MKKFICVLSAAAMLLCGCGQKKDVVMTAGDVEVSKEVLDYFVEGYKQYGDSSAAAELEYQAKTEVEDMAKTIALGEAMELDIVQGYADYLETLTTNYGDVEALKESIGSSEVFDFICKADAYKNLLLEACCNEYTEEGQADSYFKENYWRAKHLLLQTQGKTDDEKAAVKAQIDDLYKQVKNGADFDALIAEYNEDPGVESNPDGYVFTTGKMVQEFEDGVASIEIGEYNLVETSYGYHIVQRLALDETPEKYEEFKKANITDIYSILAGEVFESFYQTKLIEYGIQVEYVE